MGKELRYSPIVSNLPSKSDTIFCKFDMNTLKDLKLSIFLNIVSHVRAEIVAEIEKIPKFSTFTRCKVV